MKRDYKELNNYVRNFPDKWNRTQAKNQLLVDYENIIGKKVADLGCNSGYACFMLAESNVEEVVGFDIQPQAIAFADTVNRKKFPQSVSRKVWFVQADLKNVTGYDNYFDTIYSFHTLEHIYDDDLDSVLAEAYKTLKPGGNFIVSLPYKKNWDCAEHVNYFNSLDSLDIRLIKANFIKVELYLDPRTNGKAITGIYEKK